MLSAAFFLPGKKKKSHRSNKFLKLILFILMIEVPAFPIGFMLFLNYWHVHQYNSKSFTFLFWDS